MNTKTLIGAALGVAVIAIIVVLARKGAESRPEAEQYGTDGTSMEVGADTSAPAGGPGAATSQDGAGQAAKAGDKITVNYTGRFQDGTAFDSNVDPKFGHVQPFTFTLGAGQVIAGWDQGLVGAKVGQKLRLTIPAAMAYGETGMHPLAGKTLVFDVEVTGISR